MAQRTIITAVAILALALFAWATAAVRGPVVSGEEQLVSVAQSFPLVNEEVCARPVNETEVNEMKVGTGPSELSSGMNAYGLRNFAAVLGDIEAAFRAVFGAKPADASSGGTAPPPPMMMLVRLGKAVKKLYIAGATDESRAASRMPAATGTPLRNFFCNDQTDAPELGFAERVLPFDTKDAGKQKDITATGGLFLGAKNIMGTGGGPLHAAPMGGMGGDFRALFAMVSCIRRCPGSRAVTEAYQYQDNPARRVLPFERTDAGKQEDITATGGLSLGAKNIMGTGGPLHTAPMGGDFTLFFATVGCMWDCPGSRAVITEAEGEQEDDDEDIPPTYDDGPDEDGPDEDGPDEDGAAVKMAIVVNDKLGEAEYEIEKLPVGEAKTAMLVAIARARSEIKGIRTAAPSSVHEPERVDAAQPSHFTGQKGNALAGFKKLFGEIQELVGGYAEGLPVSRSRGNIIGLNGIVIMVGISNIVGVAYATLASVASACLTEDFWVIGGDASVRVLDAEAAMDAFVALTVGFSEIVKVVAGKIASARLAQDLWNIIGDASVQLFHAETAMDTFTTLLVDPASFKLAIVIALVTLVLLVLLVLLALRRRARPVAPIGGAIVVRKISRPTRAFLVHVSTLLERGAKLHFAGILQTLLGDALPARAAMSMTHRVICARIWAELQAEVALVRPSPSPELLLKVLQIVKKTVRVIPLIKSIPEQKKNTYFRLANTDSMGYSLNAWPLLQPFPSDNTFRGNLDAGLGAKDVLKGIIPVYSIGRPSSWADSMLSPVVKSHSSCGLQSVSILRKEFHDGARPMGIAF